MSEMLKELNVEELTLEQINDTIDKVQHLSSAKFVQERSPYDDVMSLDTGQEPSYMKATISSANA